ncbi:hypothetical protein V5F34_08715 [Xanthobacter autotrophicus]|uniref:hypothetical protein n=1 Tax=Xanthobacter autotrophicus TaxID=280 RepID=UPI0037287D1F
MTKHSPGPWVVRSEDRFSLVARCEVLTEGGLSIAGIWHHIPEDPAEANAHLISAAPDMLEALKECLDAELARRQKLLPGAPATTYCEARIAKIRAAIAKAEGRAP